ncbi:MAG: LysR family transcriptional regulator [Woeseiaceae bacterium]|nr:LysR family transcriptional regulator [Woeseiaceae bacterium]
MTTTFDIDALRAMIIGIEHGTFARAAIELGRSQSAISMKLKKLERQSGVRLFVRKGRGLVPTEAGEAFANYARRIIALNDEAAKSVGANVAPETIRLGMPQDYFDDVMPATLRAFSAKHPNVHVNIRAGNNHTISEEIEAGRLDGAIAFFPKSAADKGQLLCDLPLLWVAHKDMQEPDGDSPVPLVLFNHPCLFRQAALAALDGAGERWRTVLTTPSLPAVWSALRSKFGVGVRIGHNLPDEILDVSDWRRLPPMPPVELRLLQSKTASPLARELTVMLKETTLGTMDKQCPAAVAR